MNESVSYAGNLDEGLGLVVRMPSHTTDGLLGEGWVPMTFTLPFYSRFCEMRTVEELEANQFSDRQIVTKEQANEILSRRRATTMSGLLVTEEEIEIIIGCLEFGLAELAKDETKLKDFSAIRHVDEMQIKIRRLLDKIQK
jgi:hypothetical protein